MGLLIKCVMAINLAVIVLQLCVLGFEIHRWNEIVGAVSSIVISCLGFLPSASSENQDRWFIGFYSFLLIVDLIFQLVNMILLICFQWVVIQYCIHLNVSLDVSEYGGVACNDWWHFGYGEINYRDRALIVTILLAIVVLFRLIQAVLNLANFRRRVSKPMFFVDQSIHGAQLSRRDELSARA